MATMKGLIEKTVIVSTFKKGKEKDLENSRTAVCKQSLHPWENHAPRLLGSNFQACKGQEGNQEESTGLA